MSARFGSRGDEGFVLALVIFLLFAVTAGAATSYLMVQGEFDDATFGGDNEAALAVARAGIKRFVSEQGGEPDDSAQYAIGEGIVTVTATKMAEEDSLTHLYYIRAESRVEDIGRPNAPTHRTVGAYALHNISPVNHKATMLMAQEYAFYFSNLYVDGKDMDPVGQCAWAGGARITGVVATVSVTEQSPPLVQGTPDWAVYASSAAVMDSSGIRWDVLTDPSYPIEHDQTWPDFGTLAADSFPVIRHTGNLTVDGGSTGRGVLIVTGWLTMYTGFEWDGIIIAGQLFPTDYQDPQVRGMVIAGFAGLYDYFFGYEGDFTYSSCNVERASRSLGYFELIDNSMFEVW